MDMGYVAQNKWFLFIYFIILSNVHNHVYVSAI